MSKKQLNRLQPITLRNLAPNIVTVLALCAGLTAIRFSIQDQFKLATIMIVVAAILDALDGRLARYLNSDTDIGAELDSLADFVNFGVAPGIILYLWSLDGLKALGWVVVMIYVICMGLRLARFNVMSRDVDEPRRTSRFFLGVPAPAGALVALFPLFLAFAGLDTIRQFPSIIGFYLAGTAVLVVSRFPTYSFKNIYVPHSQVVVVLLAASIVATALFNYTWLAMSAVVLAYLFSIPHAIHSERKIVERRVPKPPGAGSDKGSVDVKTED